MKKNSKFFTHQGEVGWGVVIVAPKYFLIKSCGRWGCFLELLSESKFMQPFQRYSVHKFFANFFCCQNLVILLSSNIPLKPSMIGFCCKRQNMFFWWNLKFGEKKFKIFRPPGGGRAGGCHSSPPIFFDKKLWKVGLFLRTFVRIKIYAAIPEI